MELTFIPYKDHYRFELQAMVSALYEEDKGGENMTPDKVDKTIYFFNKNLSGGQILMFWLDNTIVGYAIIVHFWSNEFGGILLHIDELFIKPKFRNQGIGTAFLKHVAIKIECKGIFLDVLPSNQSAYAFYTKNGYSLHQLNTLKYILKHEEQR